MTINLASLKEVKDLFITKSKRAPYCLLFHLLKNLIIVFLSKHLLNLIKTIKPDIITKNADYKINNQVVGRNEVINKGGKVILIAYKKPVII